MTATKVFLAIGFISIGLILAVKAQPVEPDNPRPQVPDFGKASYEQAGRIGLAMEESIQATIRRLIEQVENPELTADQKAWPVYLLGRYRAVEAAPSLIRHIDLRVTRVEPKRKIPRWGEFPAAEALARIGRPASRMVIDQLATEKEDLRRLLMVNLIYDVEGAAVGAILLRESMSRLDDDQMKARIESAIHGLAQIGK